MARAIKGQDFKPLMLTKSDIDVAVGALRVQLAIHDSEARLIGSSDNFNSEMYGAHKDGVRKCAMVIAKLLCLKGSPKAVDSSKSRK